MRRFKFGKLVRDEVVYQILRSGAQPTYRYLEEKDYIDELTRKLIEEVSEFYQMDDINDKMTELADMQEVIDHLLRAIGKTKKELKQTQKIKNKESGSFQHGIYIDYVDCENDYEWLGYYLSNPVRYPEIKIEQTKSGVSVN